MSKVNLALIGCGGISDMHVSGYERLDNVNVLALCSKHSPAKAQKHADRISSFQSNGLRDLRGANLLRSTLRILSQRPLSSRITFWFNGSTVVRLQGRF